MKLAALIATCVVVGLFLPLQGSINSKLSTHLNHPLQAAWVSLVVSALTVSILLLFTGKPLPTFDGFSKIPLHLFIGGFCGVIFVTTSILLFPKLGAATVLAAFIAGQLLCSVIIDHFGFFGLPQHPLSTLRMVGIVFLFLSVLIVQRF